MPVDKVRGKGRHRTQIRGGRVHTFTPDETTAQEKQIACRWRAQHGREFASYAGAFRLDIIVHQALPQSAPKKRIGEFWTSKPDTDNIAKLVADALNGVAYVDDSQCIMLNVEKSRRKAAGSQSNYFIRVTYYEWEA